MSKISTKRNATIISKKSPKLSPIVENAPKAAPKLSVGNPTNPKTSPRAGAAAYTQLGSTYPPFPSGIQTQPSVPNPALLSSHGSYAPTIHPNTEAPSTP